MFKCIVITFLTLSHLFVMGQAREEVLSAIRDIIDSAQTCNLVTINKSKSPEVRVMEVLPPEGGYIFWLATNPKSRKIDQIKKNKKVVLFYQANHENGYVAVHGEAQFVNDNASKEKYWKPGWERFYPNRETDLILIKIIPEYIEVINYKLGINGDPITWQPARADF